MKRAIVFAGQGAQSVGMGMDLAESCPACSELFDEADQVLGYSLSKICFEGPIEELTRSNHCQPAIFVTGIACCRALCGAAPGTSFAGAAGLSLGEWSALHAAGVLSFEDALRVLEARGRFMQEACRESDGAMVSIIGIAMDKIEAICAQTGVTIANLNSPGQTVLSGERLAVECAGDLAIEDGAKRAIRLKVAGAFHSRLMDSAARRLDEFLAGIEFGRPEMPVVSNVTGLPHGEPDAIRRDMVRQVTASVHWQASIEWFKKQGVTGYVECGPGKVLTGLIRRIDADAELHNVQNCETLGKTVEALV